MAMLAPSKHSYEMNTLTVVAYLNIEGEWFKIDQTLLYQGD